MDVSDLYIFVITHVYLLFNLMCVLFKTFNNSPDKVILHLKTVTNHLALELCDKKVFKIGSLCVYI